MADIPGWTKVEVELHRHSVDAGGGERRISEF
jgi:hypothetical protein